MMMHTLIGIASYVINQETLKENLIKNSVSILSPQYIISSYIISSSCNIFYRNFMPIYSNRRAAQNLLEIFSNVIDQEAL